jgi:L-seryl-tRNA(Ser) seleniumtransferase
MLTVDSAVLQERAVSLAKKLSGLKTMGWYLEVVPIASEAGGGSLPGVEIEGFGIGLSSPRHSANELARRLRSWNVPIIGIIRENKVILAVRCLLNDDLEEIARALFAIANETG